MRKVIIIVGVVLVLLFLPTVTVYNGIVTRHETIRAKWAQVENQLQRRNDLIPNLVNSVKGYAAHEKTVFEEVTKARSQWAKAQNMEDKVVAASTIDAALSKLMLVVENYPDLKADQTFLRLMDELSGTENRIAVERMRYNDAVKDYNVVVRTFPGNVVATIFGFTPATEYFGAEERAKKAPEVKF